MLNWFLMWMFAESVCQLLKSILQLKLRNTAYKEDSIHSLLYRRWLFLVKLSIRCTWRSRIFEIWEKLWNTLSAENSTFVVCCFFLLLKLPEVTSFCLSNSTTDLKNRTGSSILEWPPEEYSGVTKKKTRTLTFST